MTALKPQVALGTFTLLTLLLAIAALGRVLLGLDLVEAFYVALLSLFTLIWWCLRRHHRHNITAEEHEQ